MALSPPLSSRTGVFALALVYTGLTFGAAISPTPASATNGAYYTAELAKPAGDARTVAAGVAWSCEGTTCAGNKGMQRPLRVCRALQREFGEVVNFSTQGEALSDEKLAQCNGK